MSVKGWRKDESEKKKGSDPSEGSSVFTFRRILSFRLFTLRGKTGFSDR